MEIIPLNTELIRQMTEEGFAAKRIAVLLEEPEKEIRVIIADNDWKMSSETFTEDKIANIVSLYERGVSAKSLGLKYHISKSKVQKWAREKGILRDKNTSHRFTEFDQATFDVIDTPAKAYWLGFFYADAYNCDMTNTFSVSLSDKDYDHLVKLAQFVGLPVGKITRYFSYIEDKEYPTCAIRLYSKHICTKMTELGCPRAKSLIIKYPDFLSDALNAHFIRGMFDGDGCLTYREDYGEYKWDLVSTREGCNSIREILSDNIGFKTQMHYISTTQNNTYQLEQGGNEKVLRILDWLYKDSDSSIRLDRKHQKYLTLIEHQSKRDFTKQKYKLSNEEKAIIYEEIESGIKIGEIARKHNIHPRTVTSIGKNNKRSPSPFDQIVRINDCDLLAPNIKLMSLSDKEALIEPLFQHFRQQGWLYPTDLAKVDKEWARLVDYQPDLTVTELFNNSSLATYVCKFFCRQFYDATERGKSSPREVFHDDEKLRRLIRNRLGFDWQEDTNRETFNISFRMLIQGMRSSRLAPPISIFKPDIAKFLCMKYSSEGDIVFDYSAGWGGRMLGAASSNRNYIGIDPLTVDDLEKMRAHLSLPNITLIKDGSENVRLSENSVDFSFSSPPYGNQEMYSNELTQAYNRGDGHFYDVYWKQTLENSRYMLKPGKWFGLNVANHPRMLQMAIDIFGPVLETIKLRTVRNNLNKTAGIEKIESIYLFKNNK